MQSTLRSQSTEPFLAQQASNSIEVAAAQCRDSLQQCIAIPTLMQLEWAENRLAEFKLWAATTGALAGGAASLDARLTMESDTKNLVQGLLVLLSGCLGRCKQLALYSSEETEEVSKETDEVNSASEDEDDDEWWADDPQEADSHRSLDAAKDIPRGFSPWSDDSSSRPGSDSRSMPEDISPLAEAKAEVEQIINHLTRVALAIRKSGTTSRLHKADRLFDPGNHGKFRRHLELIVLARGRRDGSKDYHIDSEALTDIQERLILANLRRRNRYTYAQKHVKKLAVDSTSSNNKGGTPAEIDRLALRQNHLAATAPASERMTEARKSQTLGQEEDILPNWNVVPTATSASRVAQTIDAVPERTPTPSRVAKTNITTTAAKIAYPKPPRSKVVRYFQCPCCSQTLPDLYREKTLWIKHLIADICPYTCILTECPTPERLYVTRHEWMRHIEKQHGQCWKCPACSVPGKRSVIFPSVDMFLHHLREVHSESINEEQYSTIVTLAVRPVPTGICGCPLCESSGPADSPELLDHIAEHLHDFALRSLPWLNDTPTSADLDEAADPEDPYFNEENYFDQKSENESKPDVIFTDSDRDSDGLASLNMTAESEEYQMWQWLSPPDPSTDLEAARAVVIEGTGSWILESVTFSEWNSGKRQHLFLFGPPGFGKTVLITMLIDRLQEIGSPRPTLFFFFKFAETGKNTFDSLLRSLAWQLYCYESRSRKILDKLCAVCSDGISQPETHQLSAYVTMMMQSSEGASIIMDALDECTTSDEGELLSWLESVSSDSSLAGIKLIVTGRSHLINRARSLFGAENCVILGQDVGNVNAIRTYLELRLNQDRDFIVKSLPQDLVDELRNIVRNNADDSFLLAKISIEALAGCSSLDSIKSTLNNLDPSRPPSDLIQIYGGIIQSIPHNHKREAIRLLQFAIWTESPLTLSEVNDIMATRIYTAPRRFDVHDRLGSEDDLLQKYHAMPLFGLSSYEEGPKTINILHLSIREFLLADSQFQMAAASIPITLTALAYIKTIKETPEEALEDFPLAKRAAKMILNFARYAEADDGVFSEILSFLSHPAAMKRWYRLSPTPTWDRSKSALYFPCKSGLLRVVKRLLELGRDVNEGNGTRLGALYASSESGHDDVVRLLLHHGADFNAGYAESCAPLQVASKNGHLNVVKLLLDCGAKTETDSKVGDDPLVLASSRGHVEVVKLLLESGAQPEGGDGPGNIALVEASRNGRIDVIRLLLGWRHGFYSPNAHSRSEAIWAASEEGHDEIVNLLQAARLHKAASKGDYDTVKALLDDGADLEATPALYAAESKGHTEIVNLLLERGADWNPPLEEFLRNTGGVGSEVHPRDL